MADRTTGSPPGSPPGPGPVHAGGDPGPSAGSRPPLAHPSILPGGIPASAGLPLAEARLTDRQRLGILLQAAAVLSHLDHAAWHLPAGWERSRATTDGLLIVPAPEPGRSPAAVQEMLVELLSVLFGVRGPVPGRGEARRAARCLGERWRQGLAAVSADRAVAEILEEAAFLWEPPLSLCRRGLAAEHLPGGPGRQGDSAPHLWVAGPGPFRSRLLARSADLPSLAELLASAAARELWNGAAGGEPAMLAAAGRYRAAVAAWEARPPRGPAERLALARCLFALGRFTRVLATLAGERSAAATCLRVRCQYQLGELGAARIALCRLVAAPLAPAETVEVAEVALRVYANQGNTEQARAWVRRALKAAGRGPLAPRAALAAAEAAWDARDAKEMKRRLEAARPALADLALAWRWHQAQGLLAMAAADGGRMVASLTRALASRRALFPHQAAGLWSDLGVGRAQLDDLPGAERAFRHAVRLLDGCDGPRRTTLALFNLAEIRLRRGHLAGMREVLERSAAENRRAGNQRGLAQDAELLARCELAAGRPGAALDLCRGALAELGRRKLAWGREELHALAARALGWLARPTEAAAHLARVSPEALAALFEPEERPALWAHAGQPDGARAAAGGTHFAALWDAALAGAAAPPAAWAALDALEPYRAARLVLDLERVAPGIAPAERRDRAAAVLRLAGAVPLSEQLEAAEEAPWRALAAYLGQPPGEPEALAALFAGAGHARVELAWAGEAGERRLLVNGPGGDRELSAELTGGSLTLRAARIDPALGALFALAARDLSLAATLSTSSGASAGSPGSPAAVGASGTSSPGVHPSGLAGEHPAFCSALARAARLANGTLTVLIQGESGTGKELVARLIHRAGDRARAPFVAVNCAALSETLILSDLFGHARGAFTGADRDRAGVFEAAHGGTVFLDEIGDLPAAAQGMLLRVLQEGEVRRLGESLPRRVDARVVAATHRDLARMSKEGSFRLDLYYRLNVGRVELPPLRERGGDVMLLARHLLSRQAVRQGSPPPCLSRAAEAALSAHPWPGNVRELENVLAAAAAFAGGETIGPEHLDLPKSTAAGAGASVYHQEVDALRRRLVADAIAACGGNRAEAARRLGLSRQALSYLVRQLRLI